jgi:hypothetical protein
VQNCDAAGSGSRLGVWLAVGERVMDGAGLASYPRDLLGGGRDTTVRRPVRSGPGICINLTANLSRRYHGAWR